MVDVTELPTPRVTRANWGKQLNDAIQSRYERALELISGLGSKSLPFDTPGTPWTGQTIGNAVNLVYLELASKINEMWAAQSVSAGITRPAALSSGAWVLGGNYGYSTAGGGAAIHDARWNFHVGPGVWNLGVSFLKSGNAGITTIDYSLDGGATWTTIAANVDMYGGGYDVREANVNVTSRSRLIFRISSTGNKNPASTNWYFLPSEIGLARVS